MAILPGQRFVLSEDPRRVLVMDFNAFCEAEAITGVSLMEGELAFKSLRVLRGLIWAGLLHEQPDITLKDAGLIINELGMEHCFNAVAEAIVIAMPHMEEDKGGASDDSDPPSP